MPGYRWKGPAQIAFLFRFPIGKRRHDYVNGLDNGLNSWGGSRDILITLLECWRNGRHDWIRTNDLFRVNLHLTFTFNNLTAHGIPPKHLYLRGSRLSFG